MWNKLGGNRIKKAMFQKNFSLLDQVSTLHRNATAQVDRTIDRVRDLRLRLQKIQKETRGPLLLHQLSTPFEDMLAKLQDAARVFGEKRGEIKNRRDLITKAIRDGREYPAIEAL